MEDIDNKTDRERKKVRERKTVRPTDMETKRERDTY
jgi:hypothetical protein